MAKTAKAPTKKFERAPDRKVGRSVSLDQRVVDAVETAAITDDRSFSGTMNRLLRKALNLPNPAAT